MKKIIFVGFLAILIIGNLSSNVFALASYEFTFDRTYVDGDIQEKLPHWPDGFWGTMTLSDAGDDVYFMIDLIEPAPGGAFTNYAVDQFWLNYTGATSIEQKIDVIIGSDTITGKYKDDAFPTRDGYLFDLTSNDLGSRDEPLSGYLSLQSGGNLDPADFIIGSSNGVDELLYAALRIEHVNLYGGPGAAVPIGSGGGSAWVFSSKVEPVPEPATMLLLGSGLIGLAGFGRRKFFKK